MELTQTVLMFMHDKDPLYMIVMTFDQDGNIDFLPPLSRRQAQAARIQLEKVVTRLSCDLQTPGKYES